MNYNDIIHDKELDEFIFDTLGDMCDPKGLEVFEKRGKRYLVLSYPGLCAAPIDMLHEEWARAKKGTKWEDVELYA